MKRNKMTSKKMIIKLLMMKI
jgi:hypothetical protein